MVIVRKTVAAGLRAAGLLLVLCSLACHSSPHIRNAQEGGAVAGRIVSVPVKIYKETFGDTLKLGQCPLVMESGGIKTCKDEFEGEEVYLAKGATTVDVSKVQNSEDILLHGMGGAGVSVGVLGLVSAGVKVKVAVTTQTARNALNLMSSYSMSTGVITLHNPRPKHLSTGGSNGVLFLSELELGGNEMLLVTLEFESEERKVEVEVAVTVKILFWSITAKLSYINENFKSKASCRVQFKSSWRKNEEVYFSDLAICIPKVQELEENYLKGPTELRAMGPDDEKSHYVYHFSSWKESPYGMQFNLALINHDLEFLTEQNTEIKAVIQRINKLKDQFRIWPSEARNNLMRLNETLTDMENKLTDGLDKYHTLKPLERQQLRDIYGQSKAPMYYTRYLENITPRTYL